MLMGNMEVRCRSLPFGVRMPQPFLAAHGQALRSFGFGREVVDSPSLEIFHGKIIKTSPDEDTDTEWNELAESYAAALRAVFS